VEAGSPCEVERILRERLGVECSTLQIARGESRACVTLLTDGEVSLFRLCFSAATEFLGRWRPGSLVLLSAAGGWEGAHCDNRVLRDDEMVLLAPASECWRLQPARVRVTGIVLAADAGRSMLARYPAGLHAARADGPRPLRVPRALLDDFPDVFWSVLDRQSASGERPMSGDEWASLRARCIESVRSMLGQDEPRHPVGRPAASYRRLIIRTREMIQRGEHVSPTVTDLCESLHVSPRTLQYAFQKSLGISVAAYVRSVRLDRVRRTLSDPAREVPRISDVATRWGFWHPSQFSRLYFRQFGELPSETLAQTRRRDSSLAASTAQ
jgi:AraC family ethanolamine operon transcriptional activator